MTRTNNDDDNEDGTSPEYAKRRDCLSCHGPSTDNNNNNSVWHRLSVVKLNMEKKNKKKNNDKFHIPLFRDDTHSPSRSARSLSMIPRLLLIH